MEIHAPYRPIESVSDVLVHLGIVTIGILIALGLEGLLEWQHHRHLAQEARDSIRAEMRENRTQVAEIIRDIPPLQRQQVSALQYIDNVLSKRKNETQDRGLETTTAALAVFSEDRNPSDIPDWELKSEKERLQLAYAEATADVQLAQALVGEYDKALKEK